MDGTGAVVGAVTAGAVDLAVVVGVEVDNVDVAAAIVLDDLVAGVVRATADNVGRAVTLDGDGVLAHVLEPHKLEVAAAQAVHALALIGTNNDVAQSGALFEDKDRVRLAYTEETVCVSLDACEILGWRQIIRSTYLPRFGRRKRHLGHI